MDPITGTLGATRVFSAAYRAGKQANNLASNARRQFLLYGTFDTKWLDGEFAKGDSKGQLSIKQIEDIGNFLESPDTRPILALAAVTYLSRNGDLTDGDDLLTVLTKQFNNEAKRWCANSNNPWNKHIDGVWRQLSNLYNLSLPSFADDDELIEDIEYFDNFISSPLVNRRTSSGSRSNYIDTLVELASDISRLSDALNASNRYSSYVGDTHLEPILSHTEVPQEAEFEALYIARNFIDTATNTKLNSSAIIDSVVPFRLVVTGAPGAGKSTFVQHARKRLCSHREPARTVFLVRCREYSAAQWNTTSVVDFALSRFNAEYSQTLSIAVMRDILTLGRAVVIFDGLDEITDPNRRTEFSKRVNAFVTQFPYVSILATSRTVGYERAPLDPNFFEILHLTEFTFDQMSDYCVRWFNLVGRPDLTSRFIDDSASIPDLRLNPLMLSLLCLLYRESGAIPSRRLDIYEDCARLLFHRWDSHRDILVQGSMPDFSNSLMQEIARWFFSSTTAKAGVSETILRGMLRRLLVDQHGFSEGLADKASVDFIDFCAGRAWLLGSLGTDRRGERQFSFTHKTFYEYFAAESYARSAENAAEVAARIVAVFSDDESSVLPELLIQSYDLHTARGAIRALKELSQNSPTLLLLRLIEGVSLPASSRRLVFQRFNDMPAGGGFERKTFVALLKINPMAREQFIHEYLEPNVRLSAEFVSGWAGVYLSGSSDVFAADWQDTVEQIVADNRRQMAQREDAVAVWWSIRRASVPPSLNPNWQDLVCSSAIGVVPGFVWWAVETALRGEELPVPAEAISQFLENIVLKLDRGRKFDGELLGLIVAVLDNASRNPAMHGRAVNSPGRSHQSDIAAYIACALWERYPTRDYGTYFARLWPGPLEYLYDLRFSESTPDAVMADASLQGEATRNVLRRVPSKVRNWAFSYVDLVVPEQRGRWTV